MSARTASTVSRVNPGTGSYPTQRSNPSTVTHYAAPLDERVGLGLGLVSGLGLGLESGCGLGVAFGLEVGELAGDDDAAGELTRGEEDLVGELAGLPVSLRLGVECGSGLLETLGMLVGSAVRVVRRGDAETLAPRKATAPGSLDGDDGVAVAPRTKPAETGWGFAGPGIGGSSTTRAMSPADTTTVPIVTAKLSHLLNRVISPSLPRVASCWLTVTILRQANSNRRVFTKISKY
jgi:hypothetical protein